MSFQGINFANQRLLPSDDGRLYQNIFNDGALYGCGITYSGTKLTIAQGHLVIGGRQIEIESAEVLDVNQAVSGFAQIVIAIDLTKTATISTFNQISIEIRYAAAEDGFSTLTQTDINGSGSYYEAQLALLSLGTGGITGIVQNMPQAAFKGAAEGGGSSLNLHVVGGTAQPSSPKENTVWINTDTEITGYVFSATEPENPVEGMVWIKTGAISPVEMNVDKKNTVMVYPASCSQYVSGLLVSKVAKSYINGEWADWIPYIYPGKELTPLAWEWKASGGSSAPIIDYKSDCVVITTGGTGFGVAYFPDKINLTSYTRLVADTTLGGSVSPYDGEQFNPQGLYIWNEVGSGYAQNAVAKALYGKELGDKVLSIDVSSLNGEYYVGFGVSNPGTPAQTITVREVYPE